MPLILVLFSSPHTSQRGSSPTRLKKLIIFSQNSMKNREEIEAKKHIPCVFLISSHVHTAFIMLWIRRRLESQAINKQVIVPIRSCLPGQCTSIKHREHQTSIVVCIDRRSPSVARTSGGRAPQRFKDTRLMPTMTEPEQGLLRSQGARPFYQLHHGQVGGAKVSVKSCGVLTSLVWRGCLSCGVGAFSRRGCVNDLSASLVWSVVCISCEMGTAISSQIGLDPDAQAALAEDRLEAGTQGIEDFATLYHAGQSTSHRNTTTWSSSLRLQFHVKESLPASESSRCDVPLSRPHSPPQFQNFHSEFNNDIVTTALNDPKLSVWWHTKHVFRNQHLSDKKFTAHSAPVPCHCGYRPSGDWFRKLGEGGDFWEPCPSLCWMGSMGLQPSLPYYCRHSACRAWYPIVTTATWIVQRLRLPPLPLLVPAFGALGER